MFFKEVLLLQSILFIYAGVPLLILSKKKSCVVPCLANLAAEKERSLT